MMDALRFIFSSFWIWLGFTTLVAVVLKYLVDAIKAVTELRYLAPQQDPLHDDLVPTG